MEHHFSKAPITEALIDFRVKNAEDTDVNVLERITPLVNDFYPELQQVHMGEVQVEFGARVHARPTQKMVGYRFISSDARRRIETRIDGFTFSIGSQYRNWEELRDEARRLWTIYTSTAKTSEVVRVAVRYINVLNFPFRVGVEQSEYLKTFPEVSADYTHSDIGNFFMQLQIHQPDLDALLVLNQARINADNTETISIILDIDLFSEKIDSPWKANDESLWVFLEKLRERKNEIFQQSVTEKMKELIR